MFEAFIDYLTNKIDLTDSEIELLWSCHIQRKIKKKQFLLHEGNVWRYSCFIVSGCLRCYRISDDGNEHIIRFGVENWWMYDSESFNTGEPSKSNIDALEDSELILFTKENYDKLLIEIPNFRNLIDTLQSRSFDASQNRIYTNISYSAEEKYQQFIKLHPDFYKRVPLHMIASYLGISRETLSRARTQYVQK